MSRILCICILFVCIEKIVLGVTTRNVSVKLKKTRVRLKFQRTRMSQIERLQSLQSAVVEFVATYIPRETWRSPSYDQRSRRGTYKPRKFSRSTKSTTRIVYRTKRISPSRKERRQILYLRLVDIFSEFDEVKKKFLTRTNKPPDKASVCYMETLSCFMSHCLYNHYYLFTGLKSIKNLLARACTAGWLNTRKIVRILEKCCGKRFQFNPSI